jgi:hypothetical protein
LSDVLPGIRVLTGNTLTQQIERIPFEGGFRFDLSIAVMQAVISGYL